MVPRIACGEGPYRYANRDRGGNAEGEMTNSSRLTAFGFFGISFIDTQRMMNRLLKPYGLKLEVKTCRDEWGDQSEVKIVKRADAKECVAWMREEL